MNGRPVIFASALLLTLCVAITVLWYWSYGPGMEMDLAFSGRCWEAVSRNGRLFIDNQPQIEVDGARRHAELVSHLDLLFAFAGVDDESQDVEAAREIERAAMRKIMAAPRTAPTGISASHWAVVTVLLLLLSSLYGASAIRIRRLRRLPQRYLIASTFAH